MRRLPNAFTLSTHFLLKVVYIFLPLNIYVHFSYLIGKQKTKLIVGVSHIYMVCAGQIFLPLLLEDQDPLHTMTCVTSFPGIDSFC